MAGESSTKDLLLEPGLEPPMENGELVFDAPWQGRVFGMARFLAEQGYYSWDEFRVRLIEQIGAWDTSAAALDPSVEYHYYDHFLAALQALLAEKGMLAPDDIEARFRAFEARPHGHDH